MNGHFFRPCLLGLLLGMVVQLPAQVELSGRVTAVEDGKPVPYATVYLDGSSVGSLTDEEGRFAISPPEDARPPFALVISHVGYRTVTLAADATSLEIRLQALENLLTQVEVGDVNQRAENMLEFRQRLLGEDEWGTAVTIENEHVLVFDRDRAPATVPVHNDRMRALIVDRDLPEAEWALDGKSMTYLKTMNLKARSSGALQLQLPDLGYALRLDLNSFVVDYRDGSTAYLGSSYFRPLPQRSRRWDKRVRRNRERAYFGSAMHFGRALVAGTLDREGFLVREIIKENRASGQPVSREINLYQYAERLPDGSIRLTGLQDRSIAILYFGDRNHRPLPPDDRRRVRPLQSRLRVNGSTVIRPDGTTGTTNLIFGGDMGARALAWFLPSDYQPE